MKKNGTNRGLTEVAKEFLEFCVTGDGESAASRLAAMVKSGVKPALIYTGIFIPTLRSLGELWASGEISITEEHLASETVIAEMAKLRGMIAPRIQNGGSAVVTTLEGDYHYLGARIVADLLICDGWSVTFLGASTPQKELVEFVKLRGADLVMLAISNSALLDAARETVSAIKKLPQAPLVVVGGKAFDCKDQKAGGVFEADLVAYDIEQAISFANSRVKVDRALPSLEDLAARIGQRVRSCRTELDFSQEELSKRCGLDRTYISTVENGRHNITVGALLQIAQAMGIPFEFLLGVEQGAEQGFKERI